MISHSNSTAGNRLQRRKSVASTHTASSGHLRSTTSIDPFTTRHQAESAAVEAYFRLRQQQVPTVEPYRPAPPKLQRRKSQVTGRTEGSHLEDARLGRRQSTSRKGENSKSKSSNNTQHFRREQPQNVSADHEERIITRRRSVIQPDPVVHHQNHACLAAPSSARPARTFHSACSDGSPAPRNHQLTSYDLSRTRSRTTQRSRDRSRRLSDFPAFDSSYGVLHDDTIHRRASIRETQTDDDILAMARDKCLLDFQQGKLRQRKSFLQMAFPKRRSTPSDSPPSSHNNFDRALPPFNSADDPPLGPIHVLPWDTPTAQHGAQDKSKKGRSFTTTLKGRFMKVLGKGPKTSIEMPIQHVVAQRDHYTLTDPASLAAQDGDKGSSGRRLPEEYGVEHANGSGRSRVTSWTNSTAAGTVTTRDDPLHGANPSRVDADSKTPHQVIRKTSSFFGRSIRKKLRRPSRSELNASEESQRLYSALQAHMQPSEPDCTQSNLQQPPSLRTASALSTLPSQQRAASEARSQQSTIRTVTPNTHQFRVPSPVAEVASPPQSGTRDALAVPPSQETIAKRVQKSRNRWQTQLQSSQADRPSPDDDVDNPYELPSRGRQDDTSPKNHTNLTPAASAMLSPSVYSRATDVHSRPDTPAEHSGTIVKITSREVRSYSISPKKSENPPVMVQGSAEWRRWLAGEMTAFQPALENDVDYYPTLRQTAVEARQTLPVEGVSVNDHASGNESDGLQNRARRTRPRPTNSRKSSFMNERYPMIDGSRDSSDKSLQNRRVSSAGASNIVTADDKVTHAVQSVADVDHHRRVARPTQDLAKATQRPKSALELRVQYKSRAASTARPLEVRRKMTQDVGSMHGNLNLGDKTIRDISAGPYAMRSASKRNKENSPMISPEAPSLPTLPSSEWLAAGSSRPRNASAAPLAIGNRNVSHYSPGKSSPGGKSSPAQRMVTQFLEDRERKSREGTPSFL